jgi:hypothetical protein
LNSVANRYGPTFDATKTGTGVPRDGAHGLPWDLRWTKWHGDRFSPTTSVSPAWLSFHRLLDTHKHMSSGAGTRRCVRNEVLLLRLDLPHCQYRHELMGSVANYMYLCLSYQEHVTI